jgi:uncharacterized cupin superfamily protein
VTDGLPIRAEDVPKQRWEAGEIGASRRRLGAAAGAKRIGVAIIEIDPGRRSTPPPVHGDRDEAFLVLAGATSRPAATTRARTRSASTICSCTRPRRPHTR